MEEFLVCRGGFVDDNQQDFAFDVDAGVIIPLVFGRVDTIANKNNGGVERIGRLAGLIFGHVVLAVLQRDGRTVGGNEGEAGLIDISVDGQQWDGLEPGAVVARGLCACQSELGGDVFSSQLGSAGAGPAPFQQIARQEAHMGSYFFRVDAGCGLVGWGGDARDRGHCGHGGCLGVQGGGKQQGKQEKLHFTSGSDGRHNLQPS